MNQLTAAMAVKLAPHGIRVDAILPGLIATEAVLESATGAQMPPGERRANENRAKLERIPLGRMGEPEEVAGLAEFLLSPNASDCTSPIARGGCTPWTAVSRSESQRMERPGRGHETRRIMKGMGP